MLPSPTDNAITAELGIGSIPEGSFGDEELMALIRRVLRSGGAIIIEPPDDES